MFKRLRSTKGISLMEILSTMVIIGIVSSMAVPRFKIAMERISYQSSDREMLSLLRLARSLAISEKAQYGIYFEDTTPRKYRLFKDVSNPSAFTYEDSDSTIKIDTLSGDFAMLYTDITGNSVVFQPNGSAGFIGGGNITSMAMSEDVIAIFVHNILASTGRVKSYSYIY